MSEKHKIPLQIFIIFEKLQIQVWTSESNLPNHFFIHLPKKWLYGVNMLFKNELNFWNSSLVDMSAIDASNFKNQSNNLDFFFFKNNIIIFYVYYFYFLKIKVNISVFYNFLKKDLVNSIEIIYNNSAWAEREVSEMFGINFFFKKDLRKLLTDYSNLENPLLKSYPTEGFVDIFYNFFEDQVTLSNNSSVEL